MEKNQLNQETIDALKEAERIAKDPSVKGYDDLNELFASLKDHPIEGEYWKDGPVGHEVI